MGVQLANLLCHVKDVGEWGAAGGSWVCVREEETGE